MDEVVQICKDMKTGKAFETIDASVELIVASQEVGLQVMFES